MHPRDVSDIEACRQALRGEIGITRAAQLLIEGRAPESRWAQGIAETRSLYTLSAEIEAANLPTGEMRALWEPHELAGVDERKQQIEAKHRDAALAAFRAIIRDYRETGLPISSSGEPLKKTLFSTFKDSIGLVALFGVLFMLLLKTVLPRANGWLSALILLSIVLTFCGGLLRQILADLRKQRRHLRKGGSLTSILPNVLFLLAFLFTLYWILEPYL